jgi:hypothetical protein
MPEIIASFKTSDNKVFEDYISALRHELTLRFSKMGENDVGAKNIVGKIDAETGKAIIAELTELVAQLETPTTFSVQSSGAPVS